MRAKCARCGKGFEQRSEGPFARWLAVYCGACRPLALSEASKDEAARIAEEMQRAREERDRRFIAGRIDALNGEKAWTQFKFETYKPGLNNTHAWFTLAKRFPLEAKNLYVYGPTGTGKTHLCTAIARSMWDKKGTVLCRTATQIIEQILYPKGRRANPWEAGQTLERLAEVDALFIDELDKLKPAKAIYSNTLQELLDRRGRKRKHGLILATNVEIEDVAATFGLPLADRINDVRSFEVYAIPPETPSVRGVEQEA